MDERAYYLGFSAFSGIGPTRFGQILSRFGSAKIAWSAPLPELKEAIGEAFGRKFDEFRSTFDIENYEKKLDKAQVFFVAKIDKEYPKLLNQVAGSPIGLFVHGNVDLLDSHPGALAIGPQKDSIGRQGDLQNDMSARTIAVVGTRKTTQYGRQVTGMITRGLVEAGFTIVSGLAMGVDSIAHMTTVESSGKTIAVLGCGVDCCSPRANQGIYNSILSSGGAIVSEVPLGHEPTKGMFPSRNRIIAGLSLGVIVTEGAEDSGSLITAKDALKFGRPVFAVPGPITSDMSKGPYALISKGARLVTKVEDVLDGLHIARGALQRGKTIKLQSKEEQVIWDLLVSEPMQIDEIIRESHLDSSVVSTTLSMMEIQGIVRSSGGIFTLIA